MAAIITLSGMTVIGFLTIITCMLTEKSQEERMLEDGEQVKVINEYRKKKKVKEKNTKSS